MLTEYIILYDGPLVTYRDGTEAEDYIVIGFKEAESPEHALAQAIHKTSPMKTDLAKESDFKAIEINRDNTGFPTYQSAEDADLEVGTRVYHSEYGVGDVVTSQGGYPGLYVEWDAPGDNPPMTSLPTIESELALI